MGTFDLFLDLELDRMLADQEASQQTIMLNITL